MDLRDAEGVHFLTLEPLTYQFAEVRGDSFDDNWLVIKGKARSDVERWTFQNPCLLVGEAHTLGTWLRSVADGEASTMAPDDEGHLWPTTNHIEPNVGFGLVSEGHNVVTIRAFLWLESGPPSVAALSSQMAWFMDLTMTRDSLRAAAAEWTGELAKFPQRG